MNPDKFAAISPYLEDIAMLMEQMLLEDTDAAKQIRYSLKEISEALGSEFSLDLNVYLQAYANKEQRALPLIQIGLSTSDGDGPYFATADTTPHRYLVGGTIHVVPQDRCPACWEEWMNKFEQSTCEHCGASLGKDCKVLLDSDTCPHCEEGRVTMQKPICDHCGYEVDLKMVTWG